MDGTVRCGTCFRSERWTGDAETIRVDVVMAGGGRRPDVPADLAIWRTWRRVASGEGEAPVAACSGCGQPMFRVDGDVPALSGWQLVLPDGVIVVGADGSVEDGATADRKVEEHFRAATEVKLTKGEIGFAVVGMVMGAGLAAVIGLIDCPSIAVGMAAAAAAPSATRAIRNRKR